MLRTVVRRFCTMKPLSEFQISPESLSKLKALGITQFFPIQAMTFNDIKNGKDVVAQARTGSGKTIAFALPIIEKLQDDDLDRLSKRGRRPRVLTLAPTRELANQTADVFNSLVSYGGMTVLPIYGGASYIKQESALQSGVDVVVGAPGRVKDLIERGSLKLNDVNHVILDEVDRMLDMGFLQDVDTILRHVYKSESNDGDKDDDGRPQTLLFSATMPAWIEKTSKRYLRKDNIKRITLADDEQTPKTINHMAIMTPYHSRPQVLKDLITIYAQGSDDERCIIFCERKSEADGLAAHPVMPAKCHVLHGDIPQAKRELVLKRFREGKYKVLVTTDVAARGLDIPEVNLIIQCSPPKDTDSYIHRSGRTGRAGRSGRSICLFQKSEMPWLEKIENEVGVTFNYTKPPSTKQIIKATEKSTTDVLKAVPDDVIETFTESAKHIIKELGAERAVSAALACLSGRVKSASSGLSVVSNRTGHTGMIFMYKANFTPTKGFLFSVISKKVGLEFKSSISYVQFVKGKEAMVFDLHNDCLAEFEKLWTDDDRNIISRLEELPELEEITESGPSDRPRHFGGYSSYGNKNGYRSREQNNWNGNNRKRNNDFGSNQSDRGYKKARSNLLSF